LNRFWLAALILPAMARAEFLLPLAGEQVSPEGTGVVYQSPVPAARVDFYWSGAAKGDVKAKDLGEGLWQARLERMDRGPMSLRAVSRDAAGKVLADESVAFRSGEAPVSSDQGGLWVQGLSLSGGAGYRGGVSEGSMKDRATLTYDGTELGHGARSAPLDNQLSGWGNALWQVQNGLFQARLKLAGDLRENRYEQSANQYGAEVSWGPWMMIRLGDQFPVWDPLLMDGVRVRGASVEMAATQDGTSWLRGKLLAGQLHRATSAWMGWTAQGDSTAMAGTWERQMVAFQLGVGTGESFLANLTVERAWDVQDDANEALRNVLAAPAPAENVGAAFDLHFWWLRHKLELYGNAALSAVTGNRYTQAFADSTKDSMGLEIPALLSGLIPVNSSTRGTQRLLGGDWGDWLTANGSWRSGLRYHEAWGRNVSLREDLKILHRGADYESFARSVRESARDGLEWGQSLGFLANRLDLTSLIGLYTIPDGLGGDKVERLYQLTGTVLSNEGSSLYLTGTNRTQTSDSSGGYTSRGANLGATSRFASGSGPISVRIGYGLQQDRSKMLDTSIGVIQNSVNGQVRWRAYDGFWEPRVSWQMTHQDMTHAIEQRVLAGVGARLLGRRLDFQFDAGGGRQSLTDHSRWSRLEQTASASLTLGEASSVRLSQQLAWLNPRMDFRADLGWETYF